ncbi:MAG: hypothetical protein AAGN35_12045 [Bacteroidota bacterium]
MPKAFAYLGLVMGAIFIGFGILISVSPPDVPVIAQNPYIVSFIIIMYGLFRIYRSLMALKQHRDRLR